MKKLPVAILIPISIAAWVLTDKIAAFVAFILLGAL